MPRGSWPLPASDVSGLDAEWVDVQKAFVQIGDVTASRVALAVKLDEPPPWHAFDPVVVPFVVDDVHHVQRTFECGCGELRRPITSKTVHVWRSPGAAQTASAASSRNGPANTAKRGNTSRSSSSSRS